jgi:hypothetical protein
MYIYIYIHTHTHTHTHIRCQLHTYIHTHTHTNQVAFFAHEGYANIVGGCCGAGPEHLSCITSATENARQIRVPSASNNGGHFDADLYQNDPREDQYNMNGHGDKEKYPGRNDKDPGGKGPQHASVERSTTSMFPVRRPRFVLSGSEMLTWWRTDCDAEKRPEKRVNDQNGLRANGSNRADLDVNNNCDPGKDASDPGKDDKTTTARLAVVVDLTDRADVSCLHKVREVCADEDVHIVGIKVHIYIYIYIYIYISIHSAHLYICIHAHMVCADEDVHIVGIKVHIYIYIYIYIYVCVCVCVYVSIHSPHLYICIHAHMVCADEDVFMLEIDV